jgi:hypothetical protein
MDLKYSRPQLNYVLIGVCLDQLATTYTFFAGGIYTFSYHSSIICAAYVICI